MEKLPINCPICGGRIVIEKFKCVRCGVSVEGKFEIPEILLNDTQWGFVKLFLKVRGNLKEMERMLGVSYPTIRSRLEEVRKVFGFTDVMDEREEILAELERGDITVEEALKRIGELKGGNE